MKTVTVEAKGKADAIKKCQEKFGWTPDEIREVDSGEEGIRAFKCFESSEDARIWDNQK